MVKRLLLSIPSKKAKIAATSPEQLQIRPFEYLEDISSILGGDMLTMEEKCEFLNDIKEKASDKDIKEALKFEDNIEYRFDLVREDALEKGISQGISQGIEQNIIKTIKEMLKNNVDFDLISKVTGKSIEEIKEIQEKTE